MSSNKVLFVRKVLVGYMQPQNIKIHMCAVIYGMDSGDRFCDHRIFQLYVHVCACIVHQDRQYLGLAMQVTIH